MPYDLRQLRHARALAEEGSFARAASSLRLTQPALSRSIQELERRIGIRLFDRKQGGVEPTDVGRVFLADARELLGRAEALDREVALLRGSGTGSLVVGSGTFPTALYMPAAVGAFLRANPGVGIRLVNENWATLVAALRRRELDFVVAAPPTTPEARDLAIRAFPPRQGHFLVRPGHPLLAQRHLALGDVVAHPLVCASRLPPEITRVLLEAGAGRTAGRTIPDVACESLEIMRFVAATTDHVLLSSLAACAQALDAGELRVLPLVDGRFRATFAVIRLRKRTLQPVAEALIREVVAAERASAHAESVLTARLFPPGTACTHAAGTRTRISTGTPAIRR